ncbi:MAG: 30S ribosomal protein S17 [Candidatus Obscuribacterales bacterium]|jgi:small subunit ribosomal protein S17|nr:30S ribosomal protein S17 [Candidatus Obscuribacterales bacterium]
MPRKELVGKVVSNKMEKTVVVAVESYAPHPKYEKQIVTTAKFKAHDAENTCKIGDRVRIRECRPLSREKRWLVVETTGRDNMTNVDKDSNA